MQSSSDASRGVSDVLNGCARVSVCARLRACMSACASCLLDVSPTALSGELHLFKSALTSPFTLKVHEEKSLFLCFIRFNGSEQLWWWWWWGGETSSGSRFHGFIPDVGTENGPFDYSHVFLPRLSTGRHIAALV